MKKRISKKVMLVGAVVTIAIGGIGYKVYADTVTKNAENARMELAEKHVTEALKAIDSSYDPQSKDFLKKDFTYKEIKAVKKNVEVVLKDNTLIGGLPDVGQAIGRLNLKYNMQTKVNKLFQEVAINGSEVKTDLVIKDDLTEKDLEDVKLDSLPEGDKWTEAVSAVYVNAKTQVEQIKQATSIVDAMYQDKAVKEDVSKEQIDRATKEIAAIKNEKAKTNLANRLKFVTDELAKKEAETKAKAEAQAASTGGTVTKNADGTYSAQAPATPNNEAPQTNNNNNQPSNNGNWNQGNANNNSGASSGNSNNGGGANNNGINSGSNDGGNWTGTGDKTEGGSNGGNHNDPDAEINGGGSWEGGDFDGSGIDTGGWK